MGNEAVLSQRDFCAGCGDSYRIENLGLCTHCEKAWCPSCAHDLSLHANGNRRCACGGEVVG